MEVKKLKTLVDEERKTLMKTYTGCLSSRSSTYNKTTPFERYLSNKSKKNQNLTPYFLTAISTPRKTFQHSTKTSRKI